MEKKLTPKQKARQRYEKAHKEERERATRQFNTRLPVDEFEEITAFLKDKKIAKVDLIRIGFLKLLEEFKESR
ncbi:MAG: hypothetical protein IJ706_01065 [Clostridia bacterium]|nr:hypothetical protein [Clostridia bacterium]